MIPLKFNFTSPLKLIPVALIINEEWIDRKYSELNECFRLLNLKIKEIDSATTQGKADLRTAAYLSDYYIGYRISVNAAVKKFYGANKGLKIDANKVYTKPLRQG